VAALRLGREDEARRLWKQALKIQRGFDLAKENLDDLRRPVGQRHAPWPFLMTHWMGTRAMEDLESALAGVSPRKEKAAGAAVRRYFKKHPQVESLLPILLERGDPKGRALAMTLISLAGMPELLEALKTFALGPHGPDQTRIEAANSLCMQGLLPAGEVWVYVKGERQKVLLIGFQVGDESEDREATPPRVTKIAQQATLALYDRDWQRAEQLINEGLALQPDNLTLLNNLASAYEMQGRNDKAHAMVHEIHQHKPDYLFARVSLARLAIRDGELERAHELLDPLLRRKKLHFSEFNDLCAVLIDLYLAEDNRDAARAWFEMWESVDPDNRKLAIYRLRVGKVSSAIKRLLRR
jgi:hypothetical protein